MTVELGGVFIAIDTRLVQVCLRLGVRTSLVDPEYKIDPWRDIGLFQSLVVLKNKFSR
jgi:hypothetical protein